MVVACFVGFWARFERSVGTLYYGDTEMNVVAMNEGFWCGWWRLMGEMVRWVMLWNGAVEDNVALFGMLLLFTYLISSI